MSPQKLGARFGMEEEKQQSEANEGTVVVERRKHPRISLELPLDYHIVDAKENHGGMVEDVSEGGLLVYLKERIDIGTLLKVEIIFVKGLELNSIGGIAKVVWSDLAARESFGEFRYGLQFQSFHEGDHDRLKNLLREQG